MTSLLYRKPDLLHDNTKLETIHLIKFLLKYFKWKVFQQAPHSPNLAPSDHHLFRRLKKELGGQQFSTCEKLGLNVYSRIWAIASTLMVLRSSCLGPTNVYKKMGIMRRSKFCAFSNKIFLDFSATWWDKTSWLPLIYAGFSSIRVFGNTLEL